MSHNALPDFAKSELGTLLIDDRVRTRFLGQCFEYLRLRDKEPERPRPLPFNTDHELDISDKEKPPLLLCERYAILAAVYEVHCRQEQPLDPAHWPEGASLLTHLSWKSEMVQDQLRWEALVANAKRLDETDLPTLRLCLNVVRADLERWLASEAAFVAKRETSPGSIELAEPAESQCLEVSKLDHQELTSKEAGAVSEQLDEMTPTPKEPMADGTADGEHEGRGEQDADQYVTMDQAAALVNRSKKTLERYLNEPNSTMPQPDVEGGGGKPHEWKWTTLRPWLEQTFGKTLPKRLLTRSSRPRT